MAIVVKPLALPAEDSVFTFEVMAELQAAANDAARGVRDPETMRQACEEMDRTREQIFRRIGVVDFAVPTIRALRDGDDE